MNFYSHVAIASLYTEEVGVALGSMLPDFASLVGAKPPRTADPRILRGYDLHHDTDRIFHESELFRHACSVESRDLRSRGFERGTAVAAAHVGLELLLDDALSDDERGQSLFRTTLIATTLQALSRLLKWTSPDQAVQFESLVQRLEHLPLSRPTNFSMMLAERICRTLSQRPRLAVRAGDRGSLESWTAELPLRCGAICPGLVETVVIGLDGGGWHVRPSFGHQLQFRRAQGDKL